MKLFLFYNDRLLVVQLILEGVTILSAVNNVRQVLNPPSILSAGCRMPFPVVKVSKHETNH